MFQITKIYNFIYRFNWVEGFNSVKLRLGKVKALAVAVGMKRILNRTRACGDTGELARGRRGDV